MGGNRYKIGDFFTREIIKLETFLCVKSILPSTFFQYFDLAYGPVFHDVKVWCYMHGIVEIY
jgi:hypothetical protein